MFHSSSPLDWRLFCGEQTSEITSSNLASYALRINGETKKLETGRFSDSNQMKSVNFHKIASFFFLSLQSYLCCQKYLPD